MSGLRFAAMGSRIHEGDTMMTAIVSIAMLLCSSSLVQAENTPAKQAKGCTRAVLQTAVDSYLAAQGAGNPSMMLLASQVKYIENMTEIKKDQGVWNTPLPIALHRSLLDTEGCRTFTEVIIT